MSESNTSSIEETTVDTKISEDNEPSMEEEKLPLINLPAYILNNTVTMQALREIEHHLKRGTTTYLEGIQGYNIEIGKVQNRISTLEKGKENDEKILLEIQAKLSYQEHLLQRLNEDFFEKIASTAELQSEYKQIVEEASYRKIKKRKGKKLRRLLDEIEELELILLSEELERLNHLAVLEPKRASIIELQSQLRELELEKEHFESTQIHQISQLGFTSDTEEPLPDDEVVDTVVMDEEDLQQ